LSKATYPGIPTFSQSSANMMLGILKITCPLIRDTKVRRTLYLTLVKSKLSYATEVWSPANVKLQVALERVQRRATRWILKSQVGEMSYEDRLRNLGSRNQISCSGLYINVFSATLI
jgi:hypothetical protein